MKRYNLPRTITKDELKKSKFIEYSKDSSYYITLIFKESDMAFGSGHEILGLYNKSNRIEDECFFGEFPIDFDSWKMDTINLRTRIVGSDINYINYWIERNKKIKDFYIHFEKEK